MTTDPHAPQEQAAEARADASDAALRRFIGYDLKRAFNAIQADLNATLAPFGLRMVSYSVLAVICAHPGIRQSRLAEVLSIERPNLVLILDELESAEAVERRRAPEDRRAYELVPTLKGRRLNQRATAAVEQHDARMVACIDPALLPGLRQALRQIQRNGTAENPRRSRHEPLSRP